MILIKILILKTTIIGLNIYTWISKILNYRYNLDSVKRNFRFTVIYSLHRTIEIQCDMIIKIIFL